jgi:hypothetical protein
LSKNLIDYLKDNFCKKRVYFKLFKENFTYTCEDLCRSIFNVLYGSCVFPLDERNILDLLAHLIGLQLISKSEPRKILRKGTSAFSKMYTLFSEKLFSAKVKIEFKC